MPDDFERMWADLSPVGRSATSGGYFRQPFTSAERELAAWFLEACAARDLRGGDRRVRQRGRLVAAGGGIVRRARPPDDAEVTASAGPAS